MGAAPHLHVVADRSADVQRARAVLVGDGGGDRPTAVEIQPTAHCHRTCVFCSHIKRNRRAGRLEPAEVAALLTELEEMGVTHIGFSGGGEPLTWGFEPLGKAIATAARFAETSLTTSAEQLWDGGNGQLHPTVHNLLAPLSRVYINIPTVDEATWWRSVKGGLDWANARRLFTDLCRSHASGSLRPEFCAVVVLGAYNAGEVGAIDSTLTEIGFDAIYYKPFKNYESRNVDRIRLENETLVRAIEAVTPSRRSIWLQRFIAAARNEASLARGSPCWAVRIGTAAIIDPDGDVYPCTPVVGTLAHSLGNVRRDGFHAIWASGRRAAVAGGLDARCRAGGCPSDCREHRFNAHVQAIAALGEPGS